MYPRTSSSKPTFLLLLLCLACTPFSILRSQQLWISEIMYNSPDAGADSLEYIEIYNEGPLDRNLNGIHFGAGVSFSFGSHLLRAHSYVVVCEDSMAMFRTFGSEAFEWSGALSNSGELIWLRDSNLNTLDSLVYDDGSGWPSLADGSGPSLVRCEPEADPNTASSWLISGSRTGKVIQGYQLMGSPGRDDDSCSSPADSLVLVSDSSWLLSSYISTATSNSYPWPGVATLPASSSFTNAAIIGQPYPWEHLYRVEGSEVITSGSGITYYRNTFQLDGNTNLEVRFRMFVDDNMQIFLNGHWIALEDGMGPDNWRTLPHDLLFHSDGTVDNGYQGGDAFDHLTSMPMDSILNVGHNELVLAVRNRTSKPDLGGFSFRLDVMSGGSAVIPKSDEWKEGGGISIYPNPSKGLVTIEMGTAGRLVGVEVFDLLGRLVYQDRCGSPSIDLSLLPNGLYIARVKTSGGSYQTMLRKKG